MNLEYAAKRLLSAVPSLLLILTLTFFLMRLAPGGPFDSDQVWSPEIEKSIQEKYGLNQPLIVQYAKFMGGAIRGDFHESFQYLDQPVTDIIKEAVPSSMLLGGLAIALSIAVGISLGALAAWKRETFWDQSSMFVALAGVSLPSYLIASLLILVFSLQLGWLPPALWEGPSSAILPAFTLAIRPIAIFARLTRASLIETLQMDFIRTALSKGLAPRAVIWKHALRNSVVPLLSVLGPVAASLVTGSFLVEMVFQVPGLGKHFVGAVLNRDYPLVMGLTFFYGFILMLCNLLVDLLSAWADPRIQLKGGKA